MNILVTKLVDHWDNLHGRETWYPNNLVQEPSKITESADAIFIKVDGANRIQKGWRGKVNDLKIWDNRTSFSVSISSEIDSSELGKYKGYAPGWYIVSSEQSVEVSRQDNNLLPDFYDRLEKTQDYSEFEDLTYKFLRLLGIHRAFKISQDEQAGKADGFFVFGGLAVMYDCTLRQDFEEHKQQQMENYANKLLSGTVEIQPNVVHRISHTQKQVWIITRGKSRILQDISEVGHVTIKEVVIEDLKNLYLDRLLVAMSEDELENRMRDIGQIE